MELLSVIILEPDFGNMQPLMLISKSLHHLPELFWKREFNNSLVFPQVCFSRNEAHGYCQQKPVSSLGLDFSTSWKKIKTSNCVTSLLLTHRWFWISLAIPQMSCYMSLLWVKHDGNLSYLPLRKGYKHLFKIAVKLFLIWGIFKHSNFISEAKGTPYNEKLLICSIASCTVEANTQNAVKM